ncbi:hypothetical protein N8528_02725 [Akkermansiaceae bacterium]|nr:hypothetical protein [Akkermansiaceae bacterium]
MPTHPSNPIDSSGGDGVIMAMKIQGPSKALRETNEKLSKLPPKQRSTAEILTQVKQHLEESKREILRNGHLLAGK